MSSDFRIENALQFDSRPEQVIGNLLFFMLDLNVRNLIMTASKGQSAHDSGSRFDSYFS